MENLTPAELTDMWICPTCYNKEHDNCLYGENTDKMLYENELFECFLVGNPRAKGHTAISSKNIIKTWWKYQMNYAKKYMFLLKK